MLAWTWEYRYFFEILISFPLGIYSEVGLLDQKIVLFLLFGESSKSSYIILHSYQQCTSVPSSLHPCQHLLFVVFLIIDILTYVKLYLILALIYISLMISDVETFSYTHWPFVNLLLKDICLGLWVLFFFFFGCVAHDMWNLSSLTRDWTYPLLYWKCGVLTTELPRKTALCSFLIWAICFSAVELYEFLVYFGY